jgi:hypothetical protein
LLKELELREGQITEADRKFKSEEFEKAREL